MQYIFTCQENSRKLAVYELGLYDSSFRFEGWLSNEAGLAETELDITELAALIRTTPVIFVRHIFEVQREITISDDTWRDEVIDLCHEKLDMTSDFSVQTRCHDDAVLPIKGIADSIAQPLTDEGYTLNVKDPVQAISVCIFGSTAYVGVDDVANNLSRFKGGMPHFAPTDEYSFISRAEYKLLDIIDCMHIDTDNVKTALDLGAAPGGWTKALVESGMKVVSVDPLKLDERIYKNPNVKCFRMTAEKYLTCGDNTKFDLIVNDMKLDVLKSLAIVSDFRDRLTDGGYAVITFKLPHTFAYKHLREYLAWLNGFELVSARQLFYNRSEITAVYRKI